MATAYTAETVHIGYIEFRHAQNKKDMVLRGGSADAVPGAAALASVFSPAATLATSQRSSPYRARHDQCSSWRNPHPAPLATGEGAVQLYDPTRGGLGHMHIRAMGVRL